MMTPLPDDDLRFSQAVEDFAIQQLVTQLAIEGLTVAVLPRTAGLDVERFGSDLSQPMAYDLVPESDLQFVVVRDLQRDLDHAILLVNVEGQQVVLDNQDASVEPLDSVHRYRAYYSISKTGWWAYIDRSPRLSGTQMADAQ